MVLVSVIRALDNEYQPEQWPTDN